MLIAHPISDSKGQFYGANCQDCSKPMRVGDVAMVFDRGRGVYVDRDLVWHRRCIEGALERAPLERNLVAERVEEIRRAGMGPIEAVLCGNDR